MTTGEGGFTAEQKTELSQMIADAVKSSSPPTAPPSKPQIPDDDWAKMNDRQRESYFRGLVTDELGKLQKDAEAADLKSENASLKEQLAQMQRKGKRLEGAGEKSPQVFSKAFNFLFGPEPEPKKP